MTPNLHPGARTDFLDFLQKKASDYGTTIKPTSDDGGYMREPHVAARIRSTTKQRQDTFQTTDPRTDEAIATDELITERFDTFLIVVLSLTQSNRFKPKFDHYYPLTYQQYRRFIGEKQASGRYQLNLPWNERVVQRSRDDIEKALQYWEDNSNSENPLQNLVKESDRIETK